MVGRVGSMAGFTWGPRTGRRVRRWALPVAVGVAVLAGSSLATPSDVVPAATPVARIEWTPDARIASTAPAPPCRGVQMTRGQADINRYPGGTTFCLSGKHNWTLSPKTGDRFIGPAILDGQ